MSKTPKQRFSAFVLTNGETGCWEWLGALDKDGYGWFSADRRQHRAARWAWSTFVSPIPTGMQIDHLCKVRRCVNVTHLEVVTPEENLRRRFLDKTHCRHGHKLEGDNVYTPPKHPTQKQCRTCRNGGRT